MLFCHCGYENEIVKGNVGWETQTKNIFIQHDPTMWDEKLDSFAWSFTSKLKRYD